MIPDFKTFVNESVWADMHKRSNGSLVRKEDELNGNMSDMYKYFYEHYTSSGDNKFSCTASTEFPGDKHLTISSVVGGKHYMHLLEIKYDKYEENIVSYIVYLNIYDISYKDIDVAKELKKIYGNYVLHKANGMVTIKLRKGMNKFTNRFTVDLLDKLIEFMDGQYIQKKS